MPTNLAKIVFTAMLAALITSGGGSGIAPFEFSAAYAQGNSGVRSAAGNRGASRSAEAHGRSGEVQSNGQGRGNGASAANRGASNGVGRSALASELKELNAANASPQALANAAPNSMPGKLAAFRDEYVDVLDATIAFRDATDALEAYPPFEATFEEGTVEYGQALVLYDANRLCWKKLYATPKLI
ncbi:MAG: hypothetical protein II336_10485 [Loktanella sp.]|nr:hypothetical protein [Loktanella sp.]